MPDIAPPHASIVSGDLPAEDITWLAGRSTQPDDVMSLYALCLGRDPDDDPTLMRDACRRPLRELTLEMAACDEINRHVLHPVAQQGPLPHERFSLERLVTLDRWVGQMEAVPAPAGAGGPRVVGLLQRLFSIPSVARVMWLAHGSLFTQAMDELAGHAQASGADLLGKIEFVNREFIAGWLIDRSGRLERTQVEVRHGASVVACASPHSYRPDIHARFGGSGLVGFRARWAPERFAHGEAVELALFEVKTGTRVGPPYRFANSFVDQLSVAQLLAKEFEELKSRMDHLAAMVPQALSYAAFPIEHFDLYRRSHRVEPPSWMISEPRVAGASMPARPPAVEFIVLLDATSADGSPIDARRSLDSLREQSWGRWRAIIVGAGAAARDTAALLGAADPRISLAADWAQAEQAVAASDVPQPGLWTVLISVGERLDAQALAWMVDQAHAKGPGTLYWDEDTLVPQPPPSPAGRWPRHTQPVLRGPFDPDAQLEWNGLGSSFAIEANTLREALGLMHLIDGGKPPNDPDLPAHPLDPLNRERLVWALHRVGRATHIAHFLLTASDGSQGAQRWIARQTPESLKPLLPPAWADRVWRRVSDPLNPAAPKALVRWLPRRAREKIGVLIPTRDCGDLVQQSVDSLLATALHPDCLDIIVADNGSTDRTTLAYLHAAQASGQLRVMRIDEPFNWSRLNNAMARASRGDHLLFLNNDTRMLSREWDDVLRGLLERGHGSDIVGARLLYEDMTIQHAGVAFGMEQFVGHAGVGVPHDHPGALSGSQLTHRVPAVTGAFLACTRETFHAIGPFDETRLTVTFNDIDWCMRAAALPMPRRIVYSPLISMIHYESKSRGFDFQDVTKQRRADYEREFLAGRAWQIEQLDNLHPRASRWLSQSQGLR